jgi:hypothetical protein
MTRTKIIFSTLLATILLATQIIAVGAAPLQQDTPPITGTIDNVVLETDSETGATIVVVTLTDESGAVQTVRLSVKDATTLGLLTLEGDVTPNLAGEPIEIDLAFIIPNAPDENTDEAQHPVGSALSDFFSDLLGVDYDTIMEYHDDGVGFGVIAQALWMTNALEGDSEIFAAILEAKQTKDFGGITLPDGSEPQNWGQFRKAVMSDRDKAKENLGAIMSGQANDNQGEDGQTETKNNGNAPDKVKDKGNSTEKSNNGKSEDKVNGKDKNKDKGNGKDK